ncbi:MAG: hypothetical protein LBP80_01530 [Treponema sp.]|nr:hypothetical protein [Treponema sp.]
MKAAFDLLVNLCVVLARKRFSKNPQNSGIPSSADPNREKTSKAGGSGNPADSRDMRGIC